MVSVAGVAGFEPTNDGVRVRCLTAWRHPNMKLCGKGAARNADAAQRRKSKITERRKCYAKAQMPPKGADDKQRQTAASERRTLPDGFLFYHLVGKLSSVFRRI